MREVADFCPGHTYLWLFDVATPRMYDVIVVLNELELSEFCYGPLSKLAYHQAAALITALDRIYEDRTRLSREFEQASHGLRSLADWTETQ